MLLTERIEQIENLIDKLQDFKSKFERFNENRVWFLKMSQLEHIPYETKQDFEVNAKAYQDGLKRLEKQYRKYTGGIK